MSVAKSYAQALYEAAADAKSTSAELDQIEMQLEDYLSVVEASKDANVALNSPLTTAAEKVAVVEALAKQRTYGALVSRFLSLMARKGRLPILREVRTAFRAVRLTAEGGVVGTLVAADPVNEEDVQGLAKAFGKKLGKKVAFSVSTDPTLLAGMKVTVNGVTYDGTLRSQLQQLRDRVTLGSAGNH